MWRKAQSDYKAAKSGTHHASFSELVEDSTFDQNDVDLKPKGFACFTTQMHIVYL
jgi:hypothetical protein